MSRGAREIKGSTMQYIASPAIADIFQLRINKTALILTATLRLAA